MADGNAGHLGTVRNDLLVLKPRGAGGMFKRAARMAFDAYRDPEALVDAFDDTRRSDLLDVLKKDSEAFVSLWTAIQSHLSTEEVAEVEDAAESEDSAESEDGPDALDRIVAAVRTNRAAVVAGFKQEKTAVASALKGKSEVFDVLASLYFPLDEVEDIEIDAGPPAQVTFRHAGVVHVAEVSDADAELLRASIGSPAIESDPDPLADLERLAELHSMGVLTDEEFAAAKRRALGI